MAYPYHQLIEHLEIDERIVTEEDYKKNPWMYAKGAYTIIIYRDADTNEWGWMKVDRWLRATSSTYGNENLIYMMSMRLARLRWY